MSGVPPDSSSYFTGHASVGGRAFLDRDGDGARDDPNAPTGSDIFRGPEGFEASLHACADRSGEPIAVTKVPGTYAFANLVAGDYFIRVRVPEGYVLSEGWNSPGRWAGQRGRSGSGRDGHGIFSRGLQGGNNSSGGGPNFNTGAPVFNTVNPLTRRTICFDLRAREGVMDWNIGIRYVNPPTSLPSSVPSQPPSVVGSGAPSLGLTAGPSVRPSSWLSGRPSEGAAETSPTNGPISISVGLTAAPAMASIGPTASPELSDMPTSGPINAALPSESPATSSPTSQPSISLSDSQNSSLTLGDDTLGPSHAPTPMSMAVVAPGAVEDMNMDNNNISSNSNNNNIIIGAVCGALALVAMLVFFLKGKNKGKGGSQGSGSVARSRGDADTEAGGGDRGNDQERALALVSAEGDSSESAPSPVLERAVQPHPYRSRKSSEVSLGSSNSGLATHYSAGMRSQPEFQLPSGPPIKPTLSHSSSNSATEAVSRSLASLKEEMDCLSNAIGSVPETSQTWQMLNTYLQGATEELDAVRQDVEMGQISKAGAGAAAGAGNQAEEAIEEGRPTAEGGEAGERSPEDNGEPEVWIHCKHDENSVDGSVITFDHWSAEERPDPSGDTSYVAPTPLMAITENGEEREEEEEEADNGDGGGGKEDAKARTLEPG